MRINKPVAALALALAVGAAWAQDEAQGGTAPVNVEGTVVDVPIDIAAGACGMDEEAVRTAMAGMGGEGTVTPGEGGTTTEAETQATTTGTTTDTSTGTTEDVTAAGDTGGGAVTAGDDAPEGVAADAGGDAAAVAAEAAAADDAGAGGAPDMAAMNAGYVCEITREEATAQNIELPS